MVSNPSVFAGGAPVGNSPDGIHPMCSGRLPHCGVGEKVPSSNYVPRVSAHPRTRVSVYCIGAKGNVAVLLISPEKNKKRDRCL